MTKSFMELRDELLAANVTDNGELFDLCKRLAEVAENPQIFIHIMGDMKEQNALFMKGNLVSIILSAQIMLQQAIFMMQREVAAQPDKLVPAGYSAAVLSNCIENLEMLTKMKSQETPLFERVMDIGGSYKGKMN